MAMKLINAIRELKLILEQNLIPNETWSTYLFQAQHLRMLAEVVAVKVAYQHLLRQIEKLERKMNFVENVIEVGHGGRGTIKREPRGVDPGLPSLAAQPKEDLSNGGTPNKAPTSAP